MRRNVQYLWDDIDIWLPLSFTDQQRADAARHANNWMMNARLKPTSTLEQAQHQIDALNGRNVQRFPQFAKIVTDSGFRGQIAGDGRSRHQFDSVSLVGWSSVPFVRWYRQSGVGIRLALGSTRQDVFRLILRDGVRIVGGGLAVGFLGAVAISRLVANLLHGVRPLEPA